MASRPKPRSSGEELLPFPDGEVDREPLELLLPDVAPERRRRAHRVASFLRLLSADARGARSPRTDAGFERACAELERQLRAQTRGALLDLARHHLRAHLGAESFAWHGAPEREPEAAWRALEHARADMPGLPSLPAPGETALAVAARLVAGAEAAGLAPAEGALLEAWLAHAAEGPAAGEARFEALLDGELDDASERASLAGLVECLLDRGAVRDARLRLEARAPLVASDARLARLSVWCAVLCGELDPAAERARALPPWRELLPAPLVALRRAWPAALPCLSGREEARAPLGALLPEGRVERRALGAALFAVLRFGPARTVEPVALEVAPGLRAQLDRWLAGREGACAVPTEPEHELVRTARGVRRHRTDARPLHGALGAETARALALEPILEEGEVAGWVALECEHHLLPSPRRLAALAARWREPVLRAVRCVRCDAPAVEVRPAALEVRGGSGFAEALDEPARGLAREAFEALVGALGIKTQARSWWGIDARDGTPRPAASGGEGLPLRPAPGGGARAVARALASGGAVLFEEPDARLSVHADAASGVALPLVVRGRPCGALAIESARRRDFRAEDLRRLEELSAGFALALRAAQFRAWHLERYAHDVHLDTSLAGFRTWSEALIAAARSRAPVLLRGEKGSGKTVFARWLHFESGREGELVDPTGLEERARAGSLLLEEVGELDEAQQRALSRRLEEGAEEGPRRIATTSAALGELAEAGRFRHELAARLARLELFVPPLRDRREELAGLARFFLERFAAEERAQAPTLDDDAVSLLWRQPWEGNLRQLEAFVFKLVLLRPGEALGAEDLRELAKRFRLALVPRVPSRHPRRRDLVAALRSTLLGSERINKRRAAARLGWDPDTLAARLADAGLDEGGLEGEPHAWEAAEE